MSIGKSHGVEGRGTDFLLVLAWSRVGIAKKFPVMLLSFSWSFDYSCQTFLGDCSFFESVLVGHSELEASVSDQSGISGRQ